MTPNDADRKRAKFWVGYYKLLVWLSSHQRGIRWVVRAFSVVFFIGVGLLFWRPLVGVLLMFAATTPLMLLMFAGGVALVLDEVAAIRGKSKE